MQLRATAAGHQFAPVCRGNIAVKGISIPAAAAGDARASYMMCTPLSVHKNQLEQRLCDIQCAGDTGGAGCTLKEGQWSRCTEGEGKVLPDASRQANELRVSRRERAEKDG